MNIAAFHANGGLMPVAIPDGCTQRLDFNHTCMTAQTHLNFLGDIINSNGGPSSFGDWISELSDQVKIPALLTWLGLILRDLKK